ncbi:unnamed protein product [Cladocopium goreaui]|uniref:Copia protein n=1 Tax=Cladocopium goreaui TaxID=2562237 RepID=A0A9P1DMJ5_9DINO|nr:unnamed protein product [Cladocopium goreaui]
MGRAGPHLRWNRILTTSFTFNHSNYVEQINQITINKEENITKEEMTQARAVLGAIQRRAIQSGPQHSAKLPVRRDILHQINKFCREVHAQRFQSTAIKNLGIRGGYMFAMVDAAFLRGQKGIANPISWRSGKLQRVAKSSLSAEIQELNLRKPEEATSKIAGACIIDTKSVYDAFYKGECASSGISLKEKHAALDLLAITEKLRRQNTALLWVASGAQLADGLTKAAAAEALLYFPQRGQLRVVKKDPEFIAAKKKAKRLVGTAYLKLPDLTWQNN